MMRLETAIKLLEVHYEAAKKLEWVNNPVAFALYQVWRMADSNKGRKVRSNGKVY